jgi:hypothetical protein
MKNQDETNKKQTEDDDLEPWETRLSLGSYLKHLSKGEDKNVPHVEETRLDPSQGKLDR